jgi:hypothetical protein
MSSAEHGTAQHSTVERTNKPERRPELVQASNQPLHLNAHRVQAHGRVLCSAPVPVVTVPVMRCNNSCVSFGYL